LLSELTVVRTLESAADEQKRVRLGMATLDCISQPSHTKAVDGLLTGLHEPESQHLDLLTSSYQPRRSRKHTKRAVRQKYLWHEFGDLNLIF